MATVSSGLPNPNMRRGRVRCLARAMALTAAFACGSWSALAQTLKISTRPLTPQEIKDYGLTNTTQLANGVANVGIGQPVYLEALVPMGSVVTQMTWTLLAKPTGSKAVLKTSPLTGLPTYDRGDQNRYDIAGRTLLVPDVLGTQLKGDYTVVATVRTDYEKLVATNTLYGSKYQGIYSDDGFGCDLCHPDKTAAYLQTQHSDSFKRKINGVDTTNFTAACVACHVLGYDKTASATNGGFDDVAWQTGWVFPSTLTSNNWSAMPVSVQRKANVQCESCHGPGYRHMLGGGNTNMIGISLSAGNCGVCHDSMSQYAKTFEWGQAAHGIGNQAFRSTGSCSGCHSAKGFITVNDPGIDYYGDVVATRGTGNEGITCAACHDPHTTGMGTGQLRSFPSVTLGNGVVITNGGEGLICMKCHHDRYDANERVQSSSAPHYGVQGDMLSGQNAIQYGLNMPSSRHGTVVKDACVTCHMQTAPAGMNPDALNRVGGHTFMIGWNNGVDTVNLTEACAVCHGKLDTFNFGGEDYDQDGAIEGVQQEISDMLYQLALLLPPYSGFEIDTGEFTDSPEDFSRRAAAYNWNFVTSDGSKGVHNPKYAVALLRASLDDLKGGIDVDHDGLPDAWETSAFGSITAQRGSDDADGDGLSNAEEMALGTNPNAQDSDSDGVWDGAELKAGSDPLNVNSYPGTNSVTFLPAFEVGYFPDTTDVPMQFQAIDSLDISDGWYNVGTGFISANAWFYHLVSPRDAEKKFFRVITTP